MGRATFAYQIDAMLISQRVGIPTVNGYSGWGADGWEVGDPRLGNSYLNSADRWLERNGVTDGACALDEATMTWTPHGAPAPNRLRVGQVRRLLRRRQCRGLHRPGRDGRAASLGGDGPMVDSGSLEMKVAASCQRRDSNLSPKSWPTSPNAIQRRKSRFWSMTRRLGTWNFRRLTAELSRSGVSTFLPELIRSSPVTTITFHPLNPASPQALGYSADPRTLGLEIRRLRLVVCRWQLSRNTLTRKYLEWTCCIFLMHVPPALQPLCQEKY